VQYFKLFLAAEKVEIPGTCRKLSIRANCFARAAPKNWAFARSARKNWVYSVCSAKTTEIPEICRKLSIRALHEEFLRALREILFDIRAPREKKLSIFRMQCEQIPETCRKLSIRALREKKIARAARFFFTVAR
jgi:hypothetical protein